MTQSDPKSIIRIARSTGEQGSAEPLDLGVRSLCLQCKQREEQGDLAARLQGNHASTH